jgi:hypothetical protein
LTAGRFPQEPWREEKALANFAIRPLSSSDKARNVMETTIIEKYPEN